MLGVDVRGSAQLFNLPFGNSLLERVGRFLSGIVGSTAISVIGSMMNTSGPEPSAIARGTASLIERVPLFKQLDSLRRVYESDYDFKDPSGKLRFKGDLSDAIKGFFGARQAGGTMGVTTGPQQMRPAELDTFVSALTEVEAKRSDLINWVAARKGQAALAGVDLGESMEKAIDDELTRWNKLWEGIAPISERDIMTRALRRQKLQMQTLGERIMKQSPKVLQRSEAFAPYEEPPVIPSGGG